jgi:hypothetical protein
MQVIDISALSGARPIALVCLSIETIALKQAF